MQFLRKPSKCKICNATKLYMANISTLYSWDFHYTFAECNCTQAFFSK